MTMSNVYFIQLLTKFHFKRNTTISNGAVVRIKCLLKTEVWLSETFVVLII